MIQINENFKLGKSKRFIYDRLKEYKNGIIPKIHLIIGCDNCDTAETELKTLFNEKLTREKDYGYEYYTGDVHVMTNIIHLYFSKQANDEIKNNNFETTTQTEQQTEVIDPIFQFKTRPKRTLTEEQKIAFAKGREIGLLKMKERQAKKKERREIETQLQELEEGKLDFIVLKLKKELELLNKHTEIQKKKERISSLQEQIEFLKNEVRVFNKV